MTAAEALEAELAKLGRITRAALDSGPFQASSYENSGLSAGIACQDVIEQLGNPNGVDGNAVRCAAICLVLFAVKARLEQEKRGN